MAGKKADPMTMNRYLYAADNPMKYVDPTGHMLMVAIGGGYTENTGPAKPSTSTSSTTTTCPASPDTCLSSTGNSQYTSSGGTPTYSAGGGPTSGSLTTEKPPTVAVTLFGATLTVPNIGTPSEIELYAIATLAERGMIPADVVLSLLIGAVTVYDFKNGLDSYKAYDVAATSGLVTSTFFGPEVFVPVAVVVGAYVSQRLLGDPVILADLAESAAEYMPKL